jgi:hypothetical protein
MRRLRLEMELGQSVQENGSKIDSGIEKLENQAIVALLLSISGKDQHWFPPKVIKALGADHVIAGFRSIQG